MPMLRIVSLSAAALLAAFTAFPASAASDHMAVARFGQTVRVDGPRVTPIRLLSDSRCPMEAAASGRASYASWRGSARGEAAAFAR